MAGPGRSAGARRPARSRRPGRCHGPLPLRPRGAPRLSRDPSGGGHRGPRRADGHRPSAAGAAAPARRCPPAADTRVRLRVRLALQRAGSRRLPRPGARLRLRHRGGAPGGAARGPGRPAGTRRRDALGVGAVRGRGRPGLAGPQDASHPVRIFGAGAPHTVLGPRDRELALWDAESGRPGAPLSSPESTPSTRPRRPRWVMAVRPSSWPPRPPRAGGGRSLP